MEGYEHSYTILQEGDLLATEECFILKAHLKECNVDKNWVGIKGILITFMHHIYSVNVLFIFWYSYIMKYSISKYFVKKDCKTTALYRTLLYVLVQYCTMSVRCQSTKDNYGINLMTFNSFMTHCQFFSIPLMIVTKIRNYNLFLIIKNHTTLI